MGGNRRSFIIVLLVMFILFLSLISIIFRLTGLIFKFELVLFGLLLIYGSVIANGIINKKDKWSSLIIFFIIIWIDLLIIYFTTFEFKEILLPMMVSGLGFIIALIEINVEEDSIKDESKYVASKTGKKYHSPTCNLAKKIKESNKVVFNSKEEAKGYKACNCVK